MGRRAPQKWFCEEETTGGNCTSKWNELVIHSQKKGSSNWNNPKPKKTHKENKTDDRFADKSKNTTILPAGILEEENQNITSDESSNTIIQRSIHSAKGNNIESDSSPDGRSTASSSSDGEMDDCDLGKSALFQMVNQI